MGTLLQFLFLFPLTSGTAVQGCPCGAWISETREADKKSSEKLQKLKAQKLKAAKDAYGSLNIAEATPEEVYRFSTRVLNSALDLCATQAEKFTAYEEHLKRMKHVSDFSDLLDKSGSISKISLHSAHYFRIEAEIWVEEARPKSK
jgi:hypothetical protein